MSGALGGEKKVHLELLMMQKKREKEGDVAVVHPAVLGYRKVRLLDAEEAGGFNPARQSPVFYGFEWQRNSWINKKKRGKKKKEKKQKK